MDQEKLKKEIGQIEDHARDALAEFPTLAKERLRMIRALARHIRSEFSPDPSPAGPRPPAEDEDPLSRRG